MMIIPFLLCLLLVVDVTQCSGINSGLNDLHVKISASHVSLDILNNSIPSNKI